MKLYTIYDLKAETYTPPVTAMNDAVAIRMVANSASGQDPMLSMNPADFVVYRIGTFDQVTGELTGEKPVHVIRANEAVQAMKGDEK